MSAAPFENHHPISHIMSRDFEIYPLISPLGFREYDARWLLNKQINLTGFHHLGLGLGTLIQRETKGTDIIIGHDFRSYSQSVKFAMVTGLMQAGLNVHDIGLVMTPMAYFAQFHLDIPAVAMVTASHNENGWTGVKMGLRPPVTLGPDQMALLRDITLKGDFEKKGGGSYLFRDGLPEKWQEDLTNRPALIRPVKTVISCGNGTAGAFVPPLLKALGADIIELNCQLDHSFPNGNPNPEDMEMLTALGEAVRQEGAEIGLAFDGDGDRCGVVDERGLPIFADKIGLLLARHFAALHPNSRFIVDIKSTGLFGRDEELRAAGAEVEYWKTGHSHMKRRLHESGALAGFEKSGHYFFGAPLGRGYDDAAVSAIAILDMLARENRAVSQIYDDLAPSWISPTLSPHCPDDQKYGIVEEITRHFADLLAKGENFAGRPIARLVTVNGVRVELEDGHWALVRASSNKPELVIVVESPHSLEKMRDIFAALDTILRQYPQIGPYNQSI